jgi:outer membrane putative beta-barrel porin/alpha-amylase
MRKGSLHWWRRWRQLRGWTWLLLFLAGEGAALAGPPFQTDDPEPVEYRHFEMYAFELSDSTAGGTALEVPAYEVNYGVAPNLQLHLVVPLLANIPTDGSGATYGIGDTEVGAKFRFLKETKRLPEVGIFPFVELPSGDADKGLGLGTTWYRLPLWIQKSWGPWTNYGGGGEAVVPQSGYKNYAFAGWQVQRQITKKLMLGVELFGHGALGEAAASRKYSTMADFGGTYEFKDGFDLLFAGGRTVAGQPETYSYLALYWTWGPKNAKGEDEKGGGAPGGMLQKVHLR